MYHNILNEGPDMRLQPFLMKPDLRDICKKHKSRLLFSLVFGLGKYGQLHKLCYLC